MRLELELAAEPIVTGNEVSGRVNVIEGGESRSLTVALSFYEKTRDFTAAPFSSEFTLHKGELKTGQTIDWSLTMPPEAPPSVKCENSELYWELDVRSDEPGLDTHASRRVEVVAG